MLKEDNLGLDRLLLDPNNYRFQGQNDFVLAENSRKHESSVQDKAKRRLRTEGLEQLKDSILTNGFLPVEKLIVEPYPDDDGKYVVIEGNRRLAALRWIQEDHEAGVTVPEHVLVSIEAIPVIIVDEENEVFVKALLGVRHVSGIKQWGGYERAKLVAEFRDRFNLEAAEVAQRLGMTANEVNRRYRAYRALNQMLDHDDFAHQAKPDMYPIFHEAVSSSQVKTWLGWDEDAFQFTNDEDLIQFYQLITPLVDEEQDGLTTDPKIRNYGDVRQLRKILPNDAAKSVLLDPDSSFIDAVAVVLKDIDSGAWLAKVKAAKEALVSIGVQVLKALNPEQQQIIETLRDVTQSVLDDHDKLTQ